VHITSSNAADWLVSPLPFRRGKHKGKGFFRFSRLPLHNPHPHPFEGRCDHAEDCEMLELLAG
jgi:hypothetical protein